MLSLGGRFLLLIKVAQNRCELLQGNVKNAFLQRHGTGQDVELVAEPVAELAEHVHVSKEQVVVLTKCCDRLVDVPRR